MELPPNRKLSKGKGKKKLCASSVPSKYKRKHVAADSVVRLLDYNRNSCQHFDHDQQPQ